jgi:hypothetical protein
VDPLDVSRVCDTKNYQIQSFPCCHQSNMAAWLISHCVPHQWECLWCSTQTVPVSKHSAVPPLPEVWHFEIKLPYKLSSSDHTCKHFCCLPRVVRVCVIWFYICVRAFSIDCDQIHANNFLLFANVCINAMIHHRTNDSMPCRLWGVYYVHHLLTFVRVRRV